MRSLKAVVLGVTFGCLTACGGGHSGPSAPISLPTSPSPPAPPASAAALTISNVKVEEFAPRPGNAYYAYPVRFWLIETTGKSGATIQNIAVTAGAETEGTGPGCWGETIHVAPGGTLDTFDTGYDNLAYCAPAGASPTKVASVSLVVTFTDDDGHEGKVVATIPVTN